MRATKKQTKPGVTAASANTVATSPAQAASPSETPVNVVWHEVEEKEGVRFWAWSFVTVGFQKLHARATNLIFTIRAPKGALDSDFPQGMIGLLKVLQKEAQEGRPAIEGGTVELKGKLQGAAQESASGSYVVWIRAQLPLPGVLLPQQRYLMGIFVHPLEFHVAKSHGVTRLSAMLGMAANYYPCPYWTDTSRVPVVSVPPGTTDMLTAQRDFLQRSIINAFARARMMPVRATLHQNVSSEASGKKSRLVLSVPTSVCGELKETMAVQQRDNGDMYTIMVGADPSAEGQLVWTPTQADAPAAPRAITRRDTSGNVLSGSFVAMLSKQAKDYVQVYEDGFMVALSTAKYCVVMDALTKGVCVCVETDNTTLVLDFLASEWRHPIDGTIIRSDEGFTKYEPRTEGGTMESEGVVLESVALNTPDAVLKEALPDGVAALSAYIASLHRTLKTCLSLTPTSSSAGKLYVDVKLSAPTPPTPDSTTQAPVIRIASEPKSALSEKLTHEVHASLVEVAAPPIRYDSVSAALKLKVDVAFLMTFSVPLPLSPSLP